MAIQEAAEKAQKREEKAERVEQLTDTADWLAELEQKARRSYTDEVTPHPPAKKPLKQQAPKTPMVPECPSSPLSEIVKSKLTGSKFILPVKHSDEGEESKLMDKAPATDDPIDVKKTVKKRKVSVKKASAFWDTVNQLKMAQFNAMDVNENVGLSQASHLEKYAESKETSVNTLVMNANKNGIEIEFAEHQVSTQEKGKVVVQPLKESKCS